MIDSNVVAPFRPSLRETVLRLSLLASTTWLLLRMALRLDVQLVTVMTVTALTAMLALRIARRGPQTELTADDDTLRVRGPEGDRTIPWGALESVRLAAGDVTTARGDVRVLYAHVDLAHGPPLAFSDLSSLGSPRLRTAEGDAPVLDVEDPELLLGRIAERLDAREFLPQAKYDGGDAHGPWLVPSPLSTARLGVLALIVSRVVPLVWGDRDATMAALGGATAILAPHALVRFFSQRGGGPTQSEVGAPPAIAAGCVSALALAGLLQRGGLGDAAAWALCAAVVCALPSWPLPGGWLARRIGRAFATRSDGVIGALVASLGVVVAWMCARGMVLLPMALVAGGFEAAAGYAASRRHARIADLPRFRQSDPEAVARLRALLRPLAPGETDAHLGPGDLDELRRALSPPPARGAWGPFFAALIAVAVTVFAARVVLHGPDPSAARALRWLLT